MQSPQNFYFNKLLQLYLNECKYIKNLNVQETVKLTLRLNVLESFSLLLLESVITGSFENFLLSSSISSSLHSLRSLRTVGYSSLLLKGGCEEGLAGFSASCSLCFFMLLLLLVLFGL